MTPFDIILWSVSYPSCSSIHLSSSASQLPAPPSSLDQLQLGILSREIVCLDLSFADNPSLSLMPLSSVSVFFSFPPLFPIPISYLSTLLYYYHFNGLVLQFYNGLVPSRQFSASCCLGLARTCRRVTSSLSVAAGLSINMMKWSVKALFFSFLFFSFLLSGLLPDEGQTALLHPKPKH